MKKMENEEKIQLLSKLITGTGIFAGLVAIILLLNFLQMQKQDPIESGVIAALVERLDQEPDNEVLKLEIRQLDLLARKAYFTSEWQVKTGAFILLFAGIILGILLKLQHDLRTRIVEPENSEEDSHLLRRNSVHWIWGVGALLFLAALGSAFWTNNQLANYDEYKLAEVKQKELAAEESGEDQIKVVDLSEAVAVKAEKILEPEVNQEESDVVETTASSEIVVDSKVSEQIESQSIQDNTSVPIYHNAFRGHFSNGVAFVKDIPIDWDVSSGKNIIWKTPLPRKGFNSPVIWDDKIFFAGGDASLREVFCYNRNTGELLWQKEVSNIEGSPATPPITTSDTGLSAPTVTTDGNLVFAIFGTGDLIAFDFSGKRIWAKNMGVPDNHYGHSSSLICHDNKLIVLYDTNRGGKISAFQTTDGSVLWQKIRKNKISWSSPVLAEIDGKMQILTTTDPHIAGHDLETGEELWSVECLMGEVGASAAYGQGLVFGANEYARLVAIKPGATPEIVWENDEYLPEVASPVESDGLLFIATSFGVFACYDAMTGVKYWEHDGNEGYYASPMIADGKVYAIDMGGTMHIFALSKELKVLGEPKLGEDAVSSPAFSDGKIYLKGNNNLYCIGNK